MDENVNATQSDAAGGEVRHGLIGMVRADEATLQQSASWITTARGGAELHQSASMAVVSGGDTSMKMAAAVAVPSLGDVKIEKGGAQWVLSAGDVSIDKGGCVAAVAPTVRVDHGGVGRGPRLARGRRRGRPRHVRTAGRRRVRRRVRRRRRPRDGGQRGLRREEGAQARAAASLAVVTAVAADGRDAAARAEAVLAELASLGSEEARAGMARYGIETGDAFGVSIYQLRPVAKGLGRDHELALALWATGNHEARLLASMVDDPASVTEVQMDAWAAEFDSWDVCDQVTSNLFDKTPFAYDKVREWSAARDEWVKRAAFATAAALAVQDKQAADEPFLEILRAVPARGR